MKTIAQLAGTAIRVIKVNSSVISSVAAGLGVAGTVYLAAKAGGRAVKLIEANEEENVPSPTESTRERTWRRTKIVWKLYVPTAISAVSTVAFIASANRLSAKQVAAAQASLAFTERAFTGYRDKVVEEFSKRKDQSIRDKVVAEQIKREPPPSSDLMITGPGDVICCEMFTMRYFVSNMEKLRKAQNDINFNLLRYDIATLEDWYWIIGLKNTSEGSFIGWTSDKQMELEFSTHMTDDGRPCIAFNYNYTKQL